MPVFVAVDGEWNIEKGFAAGRTARHRRQLLRMADISGDG